MGFLIKFCLMMGVSTLIVMAGMKSKQRTWKKRAQNLMEPPFDTVSQTRVQPHDDSK